jgi:predicted AAA+ superfamily ATPase
MSMVYDVLESWNPWWNRGEVPRRFLGMPRDITGDLFPWLERQTIISLLGVRRSGKTTVLYQLVQMLLDDGVPPANVLFVDMEDPRLDGVNVGDVLSAYRRGSGPKGRTYILLDEVQASKAWELWLKVEYEQKKNVALMVSGSSSALVRGEMATSLTGRTTTFHIHPLSFREFLSFRDVRLDEERGSDRDDLAIHQMEAYIELGGFPEVVIGGTAASVSTLDRYYDAILYRDVVLPHGVDPRKLESLSGFLLAGIGSPHTLRSLSKATGLSVDTVKKYLGHMEEANLVRRVDQLSYKTKPKAKEQLGTKWFCVDTGLRNAVVLRHSPDTGKLVENVVHAELVRRRAHVRYWANHHEVDLVVGMMTGPLTPVNVSYGDTIPQREVEGLEEFRSYSRARVADRLLLTKDTWEGGGDVQKLPVWRWLLGEGPSLEGNRSWPG